MQILTDCQILDYCHSTPEDRESEFQRAADNQDKPVYQLPVFELCHAFHLLVKYHGILPSQFRGCYAELSRRHIESGEFFIHIPEETSADVFRKILRTPHDPPNAGLSPCEDPEIYWSHHYHLISRLKSTYFLQELNGWWGANPPDGKNEPPSPCNANGQDIVLDANNLLELLNQLPPDGFTSAAHINFPARLSEQVRREFRVIIDSHGAAGKFIVPISALEETERVAHRNIKYQNATNVLNSISIEIDNLIWNMFSFEPMSQEIFEYFVFIYEKLELANVDFNTFDDFGDLLVLAHGLYHGCKIASNEWFEGEPDIWDLVKGFFPFLAVD